MSEKTMSSVERVKALMDDNMGICDVINGLVHYYLDLYTKETDENCKKMYMNWATALQDCRDNLDGQFPRTSLLMKLIQQHARDFRSIQADPRDYRHVDSVSTRALFDLRQLGLTR